MDSSGVGVRPAAEATFIIRPLPLENNADTSGTVTPNQHKSYHQQKRTVRAVLDLLIGKKT